MTWEFGPPGEARDKRLIEEECTRRVDKQEAFNVPKLRVLVEKYQAALAEADAEGYRETTLQQLGAEETDDFCELVLGALGYPRGDYIVARGRGLLWHHRPQAVLYIQRMHGADRTCPSQHARRAVSRAVD